MPLGQGQIIISEDKSEGWPHAGRLRQPGVAGEQVEPGPQRSPPHVPGGTCLGGSSLGQLSIISDSPAAFVIDSWSPRRNAKVDKAPSSGEKGRGRRAVQPAAERKFPVTGYSPAVCNRLFLSHLSAVEECSWGSMLAWKLALLD